MTHTPMRPIAILSLAAALLAAGPAAAQIGNPGFVAAGAKQEAPGKPAPHETNNADRLFARLAAAGGKAEVELGRLAQEKGASAAVKEFARMMVEDHGKANDRLAELAKAADIPLPAEPTPDQKAVREKLERLGGDTFDVTYILAQIEDHQKTVQLLQWEIGQGQDAPLQQFAAETLPVVLGHLREAQFIATELTGQAPPEIPPRIAAAAEPAMPAKRQ